MLEKLVMLKWKIKSAKYKSNSTAAESNSMPFKQIKMTWKN